MREKAARSADSQATAGVDECDRANAAPRAPRTRIGHSRSVTPLSASMLVVAGELRARADGSPAP